MIGMVSTSRQSAVSIYEAQAAFVIPSYQRPYVWPGEDVLKLLDDIREAMIEGSQHYFIGTVMTSMHMRGDAVMYELIDGQQRITTLMLFALAFNRLRLVTRLTQFAVRGKTLRLSFAIRDQVQALLGHWAHLDDAVYPGDKAVEEDPYLQHLAGALKVITDRLRELSNIEGEAKVIALGDFISARVRWVNNVMPAGSDLNRQFTTMNTGGLQLAQSDILKSRLLKKITCHHATYDAMWQACENMGNYFERNVRQLFPRAAWSTLQDNDLQKFDPVRFPIDDSSDAIHADRLTIEQLVFSEIPATDSSEGNTKARTEDMPVYCRSIISFALLLMHTLRIFNARRDHADIDVRMHDARLIECFDGFSKTASETEIAGFLACLWEVRYQFDRWVVKWAGTAETEERHLLLADVRFNTVDGRLSRGLLAASDLTQLQSVSYFTRDRSAQYWLTPLLGALIRAPIEHRDAVTAVVERIDNALSLTSLTQKEASYALILGASVQPKDFSVVHAELSIHLGTGFEHYWFQKLEYVLWRNREILECFKVDKLAHYRITSKNSVEHVHAQQDEYAHTLPPESLHAFGNLVLLSPGENSSYSNQAVTKKWADFQAKPKYDALKLAHIFYTKGQGDWDDVAIERHQMAMLELLRAHYPPVSD